MANRPGPYTLIDRNATNIDPQYDENALNLVGWSPGQSIPSKIHNTLWLVCGLWQSYFDYQTLNTGDYVDTASVFRLSSSTLAYTIGDNVVVAPGADAMAEPVYMFDGYRIKVDNQLLKFGRADPLFIPETPKPGRIWIYLSTANVSDPGQPFAEVRAEAVAAGVADSPGAQELTLRGVDVDATGLISANVDAITQVPLPVEELVYSTRLQRWTGETAHEATASFTDVGGLAVDVTGRVDIDSTSFAAEGLNVFSSFAGFAANVVNGTGLGLSAKGNSNTVEGMLSGENLGTGPSVRGVKSIAIAGVAVEGDASAGGGTGVRGVGGAIGVDGVATSGVGVQGTAGLGTGVQGTSTASGTGVAGQGGPSPASRGGLFLAGHADATALRAQTLAGAGSGAIAVQGVGNGDATGVSGLGADGYGVVAATDTSSPVRAAFRLVPQDDDPSTPLQGDVLFNSSRGPVGVLRTYTTAWRSVHASPKGLVYAQSSADSGSLPPGNSADVALAQVQPEEVGDVMVTATGSLDWSNDLGSTTFQLLDVTAGNLVINNGGAGIREAPNVGAVIRNKSFIARVPYTVPSTALRTFALRISSGVATTDYFDAVVTVRGVE